MRSPQRHSVSRPPRISASAESTARERPGSSRSSRSRKTARTSFERCRSESDAARAPAAAARSRMRATWLSFSPGISGAIETPTGTPAPARAARASKRFDGADAAGSMRRAVSSSAKGMLT